MSKLRTLFLFLILLSLTSTAALAGEVEEFTLYPGTPKDTYTLYFPIEITEPGQIKANLRVLSSRPQLEDRQYLVFFLADARAFGKVSPSGWKKWVNKANKYNPVEHLAGDELRGFVKGMKSVKDKLLGKKKKKKKMPKYFHRGAAYNSTRGASLIHNVDAPELAATSGRYVLIAKNPTRKEVQHSLTIVYPGAEATKGAGTRADLPDLVVKAMWLNARNQVVVLVKNEGTAGVSERAWALKGKGAISLMLKKGDQSWGGATLQGFDPGRDLLNPKACVVYTSNLVISQPTRVTATLDTARKLKERSQRNNRLTRELGK